MEIRQNIQRICKEKGIKESDMLLELRLGQNYINQLKDPKISNILKICEYLKVDIHDIIN